MGQLRGEERWAQACIQHALPEATVEQHDDNSADSMYDLKIAYPDGVAGAVEVTAAADPQRVKSAKEIDRHARDWRVPNLTGSWWVRICPSARVQDLKLELPQFLQDLERQGIGTIRGDRRSPDALRARAGALRVIKVDRSPVQDANAGRVFIIMEPTSEELGGGVPTTGDPLAAWLGPWLADPCRADNIEKLASSGTQERHMFVLVPAFAPMPFSAQYLLAVSGFPLPTICPALPTGITDVWVMSMWIGSGDGFRWSAGRGWTRFAKVEPPV